MLNIHLSKYLGKYYITYIIYKIYLSTLFKTILFDKKDKLQRIGKI